VLFRLFPSSLVTTAVPAAPQREQVGAAQVSDANVLVGWPFDTDVLVSLAPQLQFNELNLYASHRYKLVGMPVERLYDVAAADDCPASIRHIKPVTPEQVVLWQDGMQDWVGVQQPAAAKVFFDAKAPAGFSTGQVVIVDAQQRIVGLGQKIPHYPLPNPWGKPRDTEHLYHGYWVNSAAAPYRLYLVSQLLHAKSCLLAEVML